MNKIIKDMPKGVAALYFIQAFCTFSYAILYSSLALFLTKQLNLHPILSSSTVALFLTFNYIFQLFGGILGGNFLSNRLLFILSLIIETLGLLLLASAHNSLLYLGLSMFLVGCGINFTCYNNMLNQRFAPKDTRRESAFILSYGAMSIGFCAGYLLSGCFDYTNQYQALFYIGIMINCLTAFLIIANWTSLIDISTPLTQTSVSNRLVRHLIGILGTALLIPILILCFTKVNLSNSLVLLVGLLMFCVILFLGITQKSKLNKEKITAYLILAITSVLFWMIYFTGPIGVILFIKNNADRHFLGYEIATQWLLNINPFIIIICAPALSHIVSKLQAKSSFSVSKQFAFSFMMLSLSFYCLICGINTSDSDGYISLYWIFAYFISQGISELLIAPISYAMIGRVAPIQLQGILMGTWMLFVGVAATLSTYFSNSMVKTQSIAPLITNKDYLQVFEHLGLCALIGAVFLFLISKRMKQLMNKIALT